MRVFITGGTGFIGRSVTESLNKTGREPVVWTRNIERARSTLGPDVALVDGRSPEALADALSGVQAVINLAGEPVLPGRWTTAKRKKLVDSRVDLTRKLVDAIQTLDRLDRPKPETLVSASAVGFYGQDSGSTPRPESAPPANDFLAQLCVDWEAAARGAEAAGVRVVCPRIGLVLGRDGGALQQLLPPFRAGLGGRIGSGEQYMPWIHLDDMVALIVRPLEDEQFPSVVNGAAPNPVTNQTFTKTLGEVLGRPTLLPVPSFALRLALGDAAGALLGGQNAVPEAALAHGFQFKFTDLAACLRDVV